MKLFSIAFTLVTVLLPIAGYAQSQRELFRPPPERRTDRVNIGYRGMFGTDVKFSNLGNVAAGVIETVDSEGRVVRTYDDGYVRMDNTYTAANGYTSDGTTAYFGYANSSQYDPSSNTLSYHSYASEGANHSFTESGDTAHGWELQYARFFGRKQRFGWMVAFSFNSFDVSNTSGIFADLRTRTDNYSVGALPPAPYTGGSPSRNVTDTSGTIIAPRPLMPLNPTNATPEETLEAGGAYVEGQYELKSAFFTFRTGPLYQFQFSKKFSIEVGLGVAGMFYSGEYSLSETVSKWQLDGSGNPTVVTNAPGTRNIFAARERDGEWLVGIYADVTANYQWTERVNVFTGVEYQAMGNFTGTDGVSARTVEVDMGGNTYARAGLGIKF